MKVTRLKKASKRLNYYINNFGYRLPIQVLIDGTFAYASIKVRIGVENEIYFIKCNFQNKLTIEDQLKNYLQFDLRLLTTPCIIIESEKLDQKLQPVSNKLKTFTLNKCGHEKNPLTGADCIKALVKENHYIVATQDRDLQEWIRNQVGIALLYLHNVVPNLDEPSLKSRKFIDGKSKASMKVTKFEDQQLTGLKKKEGLVKEPTIRKLKKKLKGPNPLSCKKKKKDKLNQVQNKAISKKNKNKNAKS